MRIKSLAGRVNSTLQPNNHFTSAITNLARMSPMRAIGKSTPGPPLLLPKYLCTQIFKMAPGLPVLCSSIRTFQALIKIHSFGLNRMDLMQREGKYNVPPQAGKTLGVEFSGWVEELGDGETGDFKVGDEVFGLAYGGMFDLFSSTGEIQKLTGDHRRSICRVPSNVNEDAHTQAKRDLVDCGCWNS